MSVDGAEDRRVDELANDEYGRQFFDTYDQIFPQDSITDEHVDWLSDRIGPGADVLELGVGTGRVALPLAQRLREQNPRAVYTGLDVSPEMLAALAAKDDDSLIEAVHSDIRETTAAPGSYDSVLCVCATISMVGDRQGDVVAHAARAVRPGGTFVVETHHPRVVRRLLGEKGSYYVPSSTPGRGLVTFYEIDGADWTLDHVWIAEDSILRLNERSVLTDPEKLDALASRHGFTLLERTADLAGTELDLEASAMFASVYRLTK